MKLIKTLSDNSYGVILTLLYCIISACSLIFVSQYEQHFAPLKLVFYSFLFATIFFSIICLNKWRQITQLVRENWRIVVMLNLMTGLAWMPPFISLKYIEPAVVNAIVFAVIPLASLVVSLQQTQWQISKLVKSDVYFCLLIAAVLTILLGYYIYSLPSQELTLAIYLGLLLAIIAGIGTAFCMVYMKACCNAKFTTQQVMSIRFIFVVIISACLMQHYQISFQLSAGQYKEIILIAVISAILPIFIMQKAMQYITPLNAALITPLQPLLTYLIQLTQHNIQLKFSIGILIFILCCVLMSSAFYKSKYLLTKNKH